MNTFWQWLDEDVERRRREGATRMAIEGYRYVARQFLRWLAAQDVTEPAQLRPEHIERWRLHLFDLRTRAGMPLKTVTIIGRQIIAKRVCRRLVREGRLPRLILEAFVPIRQPHLLPVPTPEHKRLRNVLRSLPMDTPRRHMIRVIAEVLYTSGMRPCELLALDVRDLDLPNGLAKIMGKGKRERMVPLGRTAVKLLETYLHGVRPLLLSDPAVPALWINARGRRLTYHTLLFQLHCALPDEPTRRLTCYTFRRACATELVRSGASLWAVKELLGHEDFEKLKHYVQLTILDLQKTHARCHPRDRMEEEGAAT